MLTLHQVSKSYQDDFFAVRDVTLNVPQGTTLVILGGSGSGKTTLLKMINRLIEPTSGSIEVMGAPHHSMSLTELRRSIGYVFQQSGLLPHMTVEENLKLVLQVSEFSPSTWASRIEQLLGSVHLDPGEFLYRLPSELSGGQLQRVGVACALAPGSKCLLMDEPFSALDAVNRQALQQEMMDLQKNLHCTIVFVTHDLFEAFRMGDQIAVMHEGVLEQVAKPDVLMQSPATPFVEQLLMQAQWQIGEFQRSRLNVP